MPAVKSWGIARRSIVPPVSAMGACIQKSARHPTVCKSAPAAVAPPATPKVYPEFSNPIARPRRLDPVSSSVTIILIVKIPLAPMPVKHLPTRNTAKAFDKPATTAPAASTTVEAKIHTLGPNSEASFPFKGPSALIEMRYADVNHVVSSKASRSLAISDWIVVSIEILVA